MSVVTLFDLCSNLIGSDVVIQSTSRCWFSGSAEGRACFLCSSLGIVGIYNDMIVGH